MLGRSKLRPRSRQKLMDMKPSVCLTWAMTASAVHAANVYAIFFLSYCSGCWMAALTNISLLSLRECVVDALSTGSKICMPDVRLTTWHLASMSCCCGTGLQERLGLKSACSQRRPNRHKCLWRRVRAHTILEALQYQCFVNAALTEAF